MAGLSVAQHLEWIRYYAVLFGLAYFITAYPFDVFFVRKISQKPWKTACLLSLIGHGISTITAFYILPVAAFALTRSDQTWFYVGMSGAGTGIVTTFSEYVCLRLLLKKSITGRHLSFMYWNKFAIFWLSAAVVMMLACAGRR